MRNGVRIGTAQSNVVRTADGWTILGNGECRGCLASAGLQSPRPQGVSVKQFHATYSAGWRAAFMTVEVATPRDSTLVHVAMAGSTTRTDIVTAGMAQWRSYAVSPDTVFLPDHAYAAYEALAVRLAAAKERDDVPVLLAPEGETRAVVESVVRETVKDAGGTVEARRVRLSIIRRTPTPVEMWIANGRVVRPNLPDGVSVMRAAAGQ